MEEVIRRWHRDGGVLELLRSPAGASFYRACARGCCRYSLDRWQAENDLDALLARFTPFRILDGRIRREAAASKHFRR